MYSHGATSFHFVRPGAHGPHEPWHSGWSQRESWQSENLPKPRRELKTLENTTCWWLHEVCGVLGLQHEQLKKSWGKKSPIIWTETSIIQNVNVLHVDIFCSYIKTICWAWVAETPIVLPLQQQLTGDELGTPKSSCFQTSNSSQCHLRRWIQIDANICNICSISISLHIRSLISWTYSKATFSSDAMTFSCRKFGETNLRKTSSPLTSLSICIISKSRVPVNWPLACRLIAKRKVIL